MVSFPCSRLKGTEDRAVPSSTHSRLDRRGCGMLAGRRGLWQRRLARGCERRLLHHCLDDHCRECGLPLYRCESEGGQMIRFVQVISGCVTESIQY